MYLVTVVSRTNATIFMHNVYIKHLYRHSIIIIYEFKYELVIIINLTSLSFSQ